MGFLKAPKAPEPTAQEIAGVARQSRMIDEETSQIEKRLKAAARGKSGSRSLLATSRTASSGKSGVKGKSIIDSGSKRTYYNSNNSGGSNASRDR
jgi:hypothetical protein